MLEHNKIVYDEVIERLKTSSRVCIVQATGTGKGVIASSLIEDYVNVLVIAPTNAILENYRMNLGVNSENVIFYTYKGISMLLNNQIEELGEKVSLIILDEFHRIGAETWGRKVEMLCDRAESKGCKTVGLSATPVRYLDNERDMSEEFFKGNVVNGLNIVDAVVSGVLPTFKYVVSYYGYEKDLFDKIEKHNKKFSTDIKSVVSNLENNYSIGKIIQKETVNLGCNQKWIAFFTRLEELEEFKDKVYSWFNGKVNIFILHSYSNYSGNMRVLNEFNETKNGINILLSINMLNEGVHIKDIDGVIMLRKTMSPIVYLQQLGRALQIGGKAPIIFDFIGNLKRIEGYEKFSLSIIEEINKKLNLNKFENSHDEKKIIVSSYCKDIMEVLDNIHNVIYSEKWTKIEDDIIFKYYPTGGASVCKEKGINRSIEAIYARASLLGVKRLVNIWESFEDEIISKYYSLGGVVLCLEKGINRTKQAIHARAAFLNIKYLGNWSDLEDEIIRKYYPTGGSSACQKNGIKKSSQNITSRAKVLGISYLRGINRWNEEEISILRKYYPLGGSKLCRENGLSHKSKSNIVASANQLGLIYQRMVPWTEKEDKIICKYYPLGGVEECIKNGLCNRETHAIHRRAKKLGIVKIISWTEEELSILRKYYPLGGGLLCIEKGINRSKESIGTKARELNLKYGRYYTNAEDDIINRYYPVGGYKLCQKNGLNRDKKSIEGRASILGVKTNMTHTIWTEKDIDIMKEYYQIGGAKLCQEKGLDKTICAIRRYAQHLKLTQKRGKEPTLWSDEEKEIIKKYYPLGGVKLCQDNGLFNRSPQSIRGQVSKLGLKVNFVDFWTPEEENILKEYYPLGGSELCQKNGLGHRSSHKIVQKAKREGIKCRLNRWTEEEVEILKMNYSFLGKEILTSLPNKTWRSVTTKASSIGVNLDK